MICLLESKTNPPSKFSTKHWGEINDYCTSNYCTESQTSMARR